MSEGMVLFAALSLVSTGSSGMPGLLACVAQPASTARLRDTVMSEKRETAGGTGLDTGVGGWKNLENGLVL